ncbi:hypothetical protein K0B96_16685 [Horticoccus luteus]|uniref:Uncharacterized protein n=1 Tax=Horticoccus luteus TaxID=2862869 RepID=A0A8F9TW70_9BACT|nr:hypothetical protein [Horticoccus luteus]QYM78919.1 hypothetical protein K0B96_16685 [Horticoccus luteus]
MATPQPATVEIVPPKERSPSFLAVQKQLELGGTLYGYVDVDGDALKVARSFKDIMTEVAAAQPNLRSFAQHDYAAIATKLGLADVKAMGLSSVPDGTGFFRNRLFLYTPEGRHGLLAGLGGKPAPFTHLNLAPANTAVYSEADLDIAAVYQTVKDVVAEVAGEPASNKMEAAIKHASDSAKLSLLDLIYGLKGHSAMVLCIDSVKTMQMPPPASITLPAFSLLVCVDGVGPVVESALAQEAGFQRTDEGAFHVYTSAKPVAGFGWTPVFVVDGRDLYFATSRAFYDECRAQKTGLAQQPEFQQALDHVGHEGNGLSYVTPQFFDHLKRIEKLNPTLPPPLKQLITMIISRLPTPDQPLVGIRTNLPDGILVRSYMNRSFKQDLAMVSVYNPVTIGLMSAMAIPAFQKVRTSSQQKAVLNNLRQLSAAADQYYLENGVSTTTYDEIVGEKRYIKKIIPVMGENYREIRLEAGLPLRIRLPDGRMVEYGP